MTKTKQAEREIRNMGYRVEWSDSFREKQYPRAVHCETGKVINYETTVIKLAAKVREVYELQRTKELFSTL
jgi:hypothetical protein